MGFWMRSGFVVLLAWVICGKAWAAGIPELRWEKRSDWIDVKADVKPAAVGDGVADDTAALQAGLEALSDQGGRANTLYLPPGVYRITRTLMLNKRDGIAIVGHGRTTRIVWDGPGGSGDDSRMFCSQGAPRSRYVGITWDGAGKAHVGFDHDSKSLFETEIDHKDEAFVRFTGSGLRVGHNQTGPGAQASAETTIENCLFEECDRGVALLQFNDYNFTIWGCEFRGCGTGVYGGKGCNFYVRDSHFEQSKVVDVSTAAEHSCSVRRCTSAGSRMFLEQNCIAPVVVQDCRVAGWKSLTGAVTLNGGPVVMFDCVFGDAPSGHAPVVAGNGQRVVLSNNQAGGVAGAARVTEIPAGQVGGSLGSARQSFLSERAEAMGKIIDARRDCGAKGEGKTDDTAAVQGAIDAATQAGQGAMAYLPSGDYVITGTLKLTGGGYRFGGSGIHTRLIWKGAEGGVMVHMEDPRGITIENMDIGTAGDQKNGVDVLHTGTAAGSVAYERVWVYGMYSKKPGRKGLVCRELPEGTIIRGDHFTGNMHFVNCGRAKVLFNSSYEGAIIVEGRGESTPDGMLGFQTRLATINLHGLYVRDSQSIVMSDYYVESADRLMELSGNAGDRPGRVTIGMAKSHCSQNPVIEVQNYCGEMMLGPAMFYPGGINPARIVQKGANPFWMILMGAQAYEVQPVFEMGAGGKVALIGDAGKGMGEDVVPAGVMERASAALDDLRRLGALDLVVNGLGGGAAR